MVVKMLGLGLIVLFCTLCGISRASSLKNRTRALKKTLLFLHLLSERLSYTLSPVSDIFMNLSADPLLEGLDFITLCDQKLAGHMPFPQAFHESVECCHCPLDRRDRALLEEIGDVIGASNAANQMEGLALVRANLTEQARAAEEDVNRRARLYASLGLLSGTAIAIMLI